MPGEGVPFKKGQGGRKKGVPNKATQEIKEAARAMVEDPEYRERLASRLRSGKVAPHVEVLLFHYAYGKPKDTLTLEGSEGLAELLKVALGRGD